MQVGLWEMVILRRVDPTLVFFLSHHTCTDPQLVYFAFQPSNWYHYINKNWTLMTIIKRVLLILNQTYINWKLKIMKIQIKHKIMKFLCWILILLVTVKWSSIQSFFYTPHVWRTMLCHSLSFKVWSYVLANTIICKIIFGSFDANNTYKLRCVKDRWSNNIWWWCLSKELYKA